MIEFLSNNIVWVIVGVVIAIMAAIGYFAENSEIGKKVMPKKKEKAPKQVKEQEKAKPQTFEEAIKQVDQSKRLATAVYGNADATQNPETAEKTEALDDAWSTNEEKPQEVIEANPDEWLNAPMDFEMPESSETDSVTQEKQDYLYDLPEVTVTELPEEFDDIEVLDVSDEYEDIEVLDVNEDDDTNPVEDTLAQFDNANEVKEENEENTGENNDIWK